jgi:NAD(P)-dependent dehydrogenase (short-subunit alcohol dehydrogenase family)
VSSLEGRVEGRLGGGVDGRVQGRLEGRVAAVTGAGRGIGRALALALAAEGARLVVSSRTQADLDELAGQIGRGRAVGVVADALDRVQARSPVRTAMETFGRLDILVNNVGGRVGVGSDSPDADAWSEHDDLFDRLLTLNLTSAWWAANAALPVMRAQGYGRIVNIGSGLSDHAGASIAYTAAKHGLVGLTRSLALAAGPHGITVNCLCPGWTVTSTVDWGVVGARAGVSAEEARHRAESEIAVRRALGPAELGPVLVLLASADGAGITGQVWHADGGWRL